MHLICKERPSLFLRGKQKCCSIENTMFDCVKCHRDWFCSCITILISGVEPHVKKNTRRPGLRRNWTRPGKLCPCLKQVLGDCLLHVFKLHFFRFNSCGIGRGTEGALFPQLSSCDVNAAFWMLTKCKCHDPRAGATALSPRIFKAELRDTVWQVTAVDKRNYKYGPENTPRRSDPMTWVKSVVYDIITQYRVMFSTPATENTVLARLSDPLLIYKSSAVIFPWLREMSITAVTAAQNSQLQEYMSAHNEIVIICPPVVSWVQLLSHPHNHHNTGGSFISAWPWWTTVCYTKPILIYSIMWKQI